LKAAIVSRGRHLAFAFAAAALTFATLTTALLGADLYLHGKYARTGGFNVWGYKGPIVRRKAPGEYRIVVLGGSTAFGYGVRWEESFPAILERLLARRGRGAFSVVNLAYNNEGAYSFRFTMQDYAYLDYDMVCLYEGYNDLISDGWPANLSVFRRTSPIFRLTGYMPIFPLVFREKATALVHGDAVDRNQARTIFRPNLVRRTTAELLTAAAETGQSLERQLARVEATPTPAMAGATATGCANRWATYCRSMRDAVDYSLAHGTRALVITQPYAVGDNLRGRHIEQQSEMRAMLARRFGDDPRVAYVNLGPAMDLRDASLSFDRMHLTAAGNEQLAAALVDPVLALAGRH
jgi:hypothetical protein